MALSVAEANRRAGIRRHNRVVRETKIKNTQINDIEDFRKIISPLIFNDPTPWSVLAEKVGVNPQTIKRLAYGETQFPRYQTMVLIALYYGYKFMLVKEQVH